MEFCEWDAAAAGNEIMHIQDCSETRNYLHLGNKIRNNRTNRILKIIKVKVVWRMDGGTLRDLERSQYSRLSIIQDG